MKPLVPADAEPDLQTGLSTKTALPSSRPRLTVHRVSIGVYAIMAVLLGVLVSFVSRYPFHPLVQRTLSKSGWVDGWYHFDAAWYYGISQYGYSYTPGQQSSIAFFPTYPLTLSGFGWLFGNHQVTGVLLSMTCGLLSVVLFSSWVRSRLTRNAAITTVLLQLFYPYAFFLYGAMYADSMFLLTAIGAFMLLERRHFWWAGLVGALATAGRSVGVAVAIGLVIRMLEIRAEDRAARGDVQAQGNVRFRELLISVRSIRWREFGVFLSGVGIAGWMIYLWLAFGDPLAFLATQSSPGWDQGSGPRTWFKIAYLGQLLHGRTDVAVALTVQAVFCLVGILLLRRVLRRFGWGYFAYALAVIAIPIIGTKDFMSTGRYMMVAFPIFAVAGELLAQPRWRWARVIVMVVMTVGLVIAATYFARGFEVS